MYSGYWYSIYIAIPWHTRVHSSTCSNVQSVQVQSASRCYLRRRDGLIDVIGAQASRVGGLDDTTMLVWLALVIRGPGTRTRVELEYVMSGVYGIVLGPVWWSSRFPESRAQSYIAIICSLWTACPYHSAQALNRKTAIHWQQCQC